MHSMLSGCASKLSKKKKQDYPKCIIYLRNIKTELFLHSYLNPQKLRQSCVRCLLLEEEQSNFNTKVLYMKAIHILQIQEAQVDNVDNHRYSGPVWNRKMSKGVIS